MTITAARSRPIPTEPSRVTVCEGDWGSQIGALSRSAPGSSTLMLGDSRDVLAALPADSVDMMMTSPPYWAQRQYDSEGLGMESTPRDFINNLLEVLSEAKRVLRSSGSFWLNLGDSYWKKGLSGIPWRVVIRLIDEQGWILRNEVVWNKLKGGMDQSSDRLANTHELMFHLVKSQKYYYNMAAIRSKPRSSKVVNGSVVSATGVSGVRYRRQIELSTALTDDERIRAALALDRMLQQVADGEYSDFRMVIRGQQRTTHSDQASVSGRAKELNDKGFYFLRYHPHGSKPSDVWDIIPEDTQARGGEHFAAYPIDLCRIPILSTCPPEGIVLDPFAGTGTTLVAARMLGHRSMGIDLSMRYLNLAAERLGAVL